MTEVDDLPMLWAEEEADKRFTPITLKIAELTLQGKWWGPKDVRPILMFPGFKDNCGSFDFLIPLLPKEFSYLCFDLPGHGRSSEYPFGMIYSYFDFVVLIERIRREYNWDKVSYFAHSMAGMYGFYYAALFPDNLDFMVTIENFEPRIITPLLQLQRSSAGILGEDDRQRNNEPRKAYTFSQLVENRVRGSFGSYDHKTAAHSLIRDVKRSDTYPGKYEFICDSGRMKGCEQGDRDTAGQLSFARNIKVPVLYLLSMDSWMRNYEFEENAPVREFLLDNNPDFQIKFGPGNHHFHMTHPEFYAEDIGNFIRKYRMEKGKL